MGRFDYRAALGRPVKIINDAAMQALGSYKGGKMLFAGSAPDSAAPRRRRDRRADGLGTCLPEDTYEATSGGGPGTAGKKK
jgi:hypothetical protein